MGRCSRSRWPATSTEKARGIPDRVTYYQYRHDRARRTLRQPRAAGVGGGGQRRDLDLHHQRALRRARRDGGRRSAR